MLQSHPDDVGTDEGSLAFGDGTDVSAATKALDALKKTVAGTVKIARSVQQWRDVDADVDLGDNSAAGADASGGAEFGGELASPDSRKPLESVSASRTSHLALAGPTAVSSSGPFCWARIEGK